VNEREIADLVALHVSSLPDSLVVALGRTYARSFYRYVTRSDKEITVVERNGDGSIIAAAVVSLEPATLSRRLLLHTSLCVQLLTRPRVFLPLVSGGVGIKKGEGAAATAGMPEIILLYTRADQRGRGRGTALIAQIEGRLRHLGVTAYQVKTVAQPTNPALAFYRNRNFTLSGSSATLGRHFHVLIRRLGGGPAAP
jgi:GNAT superfamily N-acetyltransferase